MVARKQGCCGRDCRNGRGLWPRRGIFQGGAGQTQPWARRGWAGGGEEQGAQTALKTRAQGCVGEGHRGAGTALGPLRVFV